MANELSGSNWSGTPISNSNTSPNGWPELMQASGLNDSDREFAAAVKRHWDRINPTLTSTGSAGAYVLTPTVALAAYVHGELFSFKANAASVGSDTLNISGLGAKPFYKPGASGPIAIGAGDFQINQDAIVAYDSALNGATGGFQVLSALPPTSNLTYVTRSTKTANYTALGTDQGKLIEATSNSWTLAFTAAATLGNGWWCYFKNSGTGEITLDPNASETIDGVTSFKAYSNEVRLIYCDGSNLFSTVIDPYYLTLTSTTTLTIPPGYAGHRGIVWGAGGAGGSLNGSGGAGGGGGAAVPFDFTAAQFGTAGTTIVATIGAGGTAGANGTSGGNGGNTTLGALITAYGGAGGATTNNGGGGGGAIGAASGTTGGAPATTTTVDNPGHGGGNGGVTSAAGWNSAWGGGGGGAGSANAGGASVYGGGGGGSGNTSAGTGGASIHGGAGGAGRASAGTATAGTQPGGGGGGAGNSASAIGGAGGAGQCRITGVL